MATKKVTLKEIKDIVKQVVKEEYTNTSQLDIAANDFLKTKLRLGTRDNIFDEYIREHNMNPNDLHDFIVSVINQINTRYL